MEYGNRGVENRSDNKNIINKPLPKRRTIIPDDCGKEVTCNSTLPLCFVDEYGFSCKSRNTKDSGWHLDPTSGLKYFTFTNEKPPELNESCILFKPPTNEDQQVELKRLLKKSIFGKSFGDDVGVWQDSLSFIGNCKEIFYCDNSYNNSNDTGTCALKLSNDATCTSANQCLSHKCSNSSVNNNQNTNNSSNSSLVCASINDNKINVVPTKSLPDSPQPSSSSSSSSSSSQSQSQSQSQYDLLIAILVGVGITIILIVIILIYKKFKRNRINNTNSELNNRFKKYDVFKKNDRIALDGFVIKPLSTVGGGNLILNSRKSSEIDISGFTINGDDNDRRYSGTNSDSISVLLPSPPPPLLQFRDSYLSNSNDNPDKTFTGKPFMIKEDAILEEGGIG